MTFCSVERCSTHAHAKGLCGYHYMKLKRHGDPNVTKQVRFKGTIEERFLARFIRSGEDECWPWLGTIDSHSYGVFSVRHRYVRSHRYSYNLFIGSIIDGLVLDHTCHNKDDDCPGGKNCLHRRCVNPNHLEPVTLVENSRRGKGEKFVASRNGTCTKGHPLTNMSRRRDGRSVQCLDCAREKYKQSKGGVVRQYDGANRRKIRSSQ